VWRSQGVHCQGDRRPLRKDYPTQGWTMSCSSYSLLLKRLEKSRVRLRRNKRIHR
jgi:hypothetical protein